MNIKEFSKKIGVPVSTISKALGDYKDVGEMSSEIVRQKCIDAPNYSRQDRLQHMIGTMIRSGSLF